MPQGFNFKVRPCMQCRTFYHIRGARYSGNIRTSSWILVNFPVFNPVCSSKFNQSILFVTLGCGREWKLPSYSWRSADFRILLGTIYIKHNIRRRRVVTSQAQWIIDASLFFYVLRFTNAISIYKSGPPVRHQNHHYCVFPRQ